MLWLSNNQLAVKRSVKWVYRPCYCNCPGLADWAFDVIIVATASHKCILGNGTLMLLQIRYLSPKCPVTRHAIEWNAFEQQDRTPITLLDENPVQCTQCSSLSSRLHVSISPVIHARRRYRHRTWYGWKTQAVLSWVQGLPVHRLLSSCGILVSLRRLGTREVCPSILRGSHRSGV